jgi:hypothetical protein
MRPSVSVCARRKLNLIYVFLLNGWLDLEQIDQRKAREEDDY